MDHSTTATRTATLVRAIEATVAGDASCVDDLFTDDVVAWSPTTEVRSRVALAVEMEDHEEAFSEVEVRTGPIVAGGDRICAEWVASATHSGPLDLGEGHLAVPTGGRVQLRGVTMAEFEGDRIRSVRHYWDEIELLRDVGFLPPS